jgi:putative ABC transport system permease protein
MDWWRDIVARLRFPFRRKRFESELDSELRFHIDNQTQENLREGMEPDEARRQALRQFGGVEQVREEVRDAAGITWMSDLLQDLKFAVRVIARSPGFALTIVLVLGLAIGVSTTIFSFVQAILIRPLPFPDAERLVVIQQTSPDHQMKSYGASIPDFVDWRRQARSFSAMAAFRWDGIDLTDGNTSERVEGMRSTRNIFEVIGIEPAIGRTFSLQEESETSPTILLSHDLWVRRYGGDPKIVGKTIDVYSWGTLPDQGLAAWEVVGVQGQEIPFLPTLLESEGRRATIDDPVQFWRPLDIYDEKQYERQWHDAATVVARLKPGVSIQHARAEMRTIAAQLQGEYPESNGGWTAEVTSVADLITADIRPALFVLSGAVAFLLLIACANVASLLLVRGLSRQQEMAVRIALGAGRFRLVRQLVTESVLLCLAAGVIGILLTVWSIDVTRALAPPNVPRIQDVSIDLSVLGFALGLSLLTGVLVGLLPAVFASRTDVNDALKSGGRGSSAAKSRRRLMSALVGTEAAVCLVLLTGAALLIRSFVAITGVDPGFRADRLLTMTVSLPEAKYEWKHNSEFCVEILEDIRMIPEVTSASAIRGLPTKETQFDVSTYIEGATEVPDAERPRTRIRVVEPDFFETMEIPLLEGRLFEPPDSIGEIGHTPVVVVNETFANRFWPDESALRKQFKVVKPEYRSIEVVGVVGDVRFTKLSQEAWPEMYYPEALFPQSEFSLLIRASTEPAKLKATVERLIRDYEPEVIITDGLTMSEVVSKSLARERFLMVLLSAFSIAAFVLAMTGHYGVVAYAVSQRRQEIGIRIALGATPGAIVKMVVGEGLKLASVGLVVGVLASVVLSRYLESELYEVSATDPLTIGGAVLVMLLATTLASLVPSLRGARVEPAEVLHDG